VFTAFTCSFCLEAGKAITYSIHDAVTESDASVKYSAWLTFNAGTRTISYRTSNTALYG
jgi:hypothetical protein